MWQREAEMIGIRKVSIGWTAKISLVLIFVSGMLFCGMVQSALAVRTIAVSDAAGPSNFSAAKGSANNYTDAFQVTTSGSGSGVTLNTVYITTTGTTNLSQVAVTDVTGTTTYGSQTTPAGNVWAVAVGSLGNNPAATLRIYIDVASGATTGATFTAYVSTFDWTSGSGAASTDIVTTTVTILGVPTVTAPSASSVLSTSATLGANVTSNGGATLTDRGTCWDLTAAPTANCVAEGSTGTGVFTQARTGLSEGSLIYYRGYATNPAATGYSSDGTIYTEPTQSNTLSFSAVTSSAMTINWATGSAGNAAQVIVLMKSGSAVNSDPVDGTTYAANAAFGSGSLLTPGNYVVYKGTGTSVDVTGLTTSTTYYVKVYAFAAGASGTENYNIVSPPSGSQATSSGGAGGGMTGADSLLHNSVNTGSTRWASYGGWGWGTSRYGAFICDTCHTPRAKNIKGAEKYMVTPDTRWGTLPGQWKTIVFKSASDGSSDFGDDSATRATSTRICEICHTYDSNQKNGVQYHAYNMTTVTTHNNKTDCTAACHLHNQGFKAAGCDFCHGNPPVWNTASGGPSGLANDPVPTGSKTAGAHNTHWYSLGFACTTCHNGYVMPDNGKIDINFAIFGSWNTGSYSGQSGVIYNWGTGTGLSCSNVYCHGATLTGGSDTTPVWNSTATGNCGTCHGTSASSPPTTGNHQRHAGNATGGLGLACGKCHPNVTDNDGNVNGSVAWQLDTADSKIGTGAKYWTSNAGQTGTLAPSASYGSCTSLYCHSQGTSNGPTYPSPNKTPYWGSSVLDTTCTGCHNGSNAETNKMQSGSHIQHVQTNQFDCVRCHSATVSGWRTILNPAVHSNNYVNIDFDSVNPSGTYNGLTTIAKTPGSPYQACTNLYCHSSVQGNGGTGAGAYATAVWGSSGTGDCGTCHGADSTGRGWWLTTGSHYKHIAAPNSFVCDKCHSGGGANNEIRHADKLIWISMTIGGTYSLGASHAPGSGYGTCSGVSCHGSGMPMWGSSGSASCGSCHAVNSSLAGQHSNHWATAGNSPGWSTINLSSASTYMFGCGVCHMTPPSTHSGGWASPGTRTAEVSFSGFAGGVYTGGAVQYTDGSFKYTNGSCAAVYCHSRGWSTTGGGQTQPVWSSFNWQTSRGGFAANQCSFCHGAKSGSGPTMDTSRHRTHWGTYGFSCELCHIGTTSDGVSIADKSQHVDGNKDVTFNSWVSYSGAPSWSNPACSAIYCHSAGGGAPGRVIPVWTSIPTGDCGNCHGVSATTAPWSTRHAQHVNNTATQGYKFACATCHYSVVTLTADSTVVPGISTFGLHVNRQVDVSFNPAWGSMGGAFTFAAGQASRCANIYCHSDGTTVATGSSWPTGSAVWSTVYSCNGCHGDETGNPGTGAPWYTSYRPKANSHQKHLADHAEYNCSDCHFITAGTNGTVITSFSRHVNKAYEVAPNQGNSRWFTFVFSASGSTCGGISCHGGSSAVWGSAGSANMACGGCHAVNNTLGGQHSNHWATAGYGGLWPTIQSTTAYYRYSCGVCHENTPGGTATHMGGQISTIQKAEISFWKTFVGNGTYTAGSTGYTDGATSWSYTNGRCSSVYCHSDGNGGSGNWSSFNWQTSNGGFSNNQCAFCHKGFALYGSGNWMTSGSHSGHVGWVTMGCAWCHAQTARGLTLYSTLSDKTNHVDGMADIDFWTTAKNGTATYAGSATPMSKSSGSPAGACANITCHGSGTPAWGTALYSGTVLCEVCHAGPSTNWASTPFYSTKTPKTTWSSDSAVGVHSSHLVNVTYISAGAIGCDDCHTVPAGVFDAGHFDSPSPANITWGTLAKTAPITSPTYAQGGSQACYVYCHRVIDTAADNKNWVTPFWTKQLIWNSVGTVGDGSTTRGTGDCAVCHAYPPTDGAGSGAWHSGESSTRCSACHTHVNIAGTGFSTLSFHINGTIEKLDMHTVPWPTHGMSGSCGYTKTGCHLSDTATAWVSYAYPSTATKGPNCRGCHATTSIWTSVGGANRRCGSCHGASASTTGAPNGSNTGHSPNRQGRHNVGPHSPCTICHGTSSGAQGIYGADHGQGNQDRWANVVNILSSINYNSSTGRCAITCGGTDHSAASFSSTWY